MSRSRLSVAGRLVRLLVAALLVAGGALGAAAPVAAQTPRVLVATIEGVITPPMADYMTDALERAQREGYDLLLVEMDTPGGLDASMRTMIRAFLAAEIPTVVYVAPSGARAASAGALITMAAHVAVMAPGTSIGAATPVDMQGGEITEKIIEDAAAYAETIAERRDRNLEFAVAAVREGRAITSSEAVEIGAVDMLATSRGELLDAIDGRTVTLADDREVTIRSAGAVTDDHEMRLFPRVLQWLADPNLAFLFLSVGTLAIIYEIANPGVGLGGILGVIMIVLAMFAMAVLPVTAVGVFLLLLAAGLFVAELFVPGVGVFAGGGALSLLLAGIFLFRGEIGVDLTVLVPLVVVTTGGVLIAGRFAWRTRRAPKTMGVEAMVGTTAPVRTSKGATGQVFLEGTLWSARSASGRELTPGSSVRVVDMQGLELVVEPEEDG